MLKVILFLFVDSKTEYIYSILLLAYHFLKLYNSIITVISDDIPKITLITLSPPVNLVG